jgi:hypothetical protein
MLFLSVLLISKHIGPDSVNRVAKKMLDSMISFMQNQEPYSNHATASKGLHYQVAANSVDALPKSFGEAVQVSNYAGIPADC